MDFYTDKFELDGITYLNFDVLADGGHAVTYTDENGVAKCGIISLANQTFTNCVKNTEKSCGGGDAVVIEAENGFRWAYKATLG